MNLKNIFFIGMVLLILTMGFVSASEQSIIDDLSVSLDDSNNQEPLAIDENFDVSNEKKDSLSAGENQDPLNDDKNENILAVSYTEERQWFWRMIIQVRKLQMIQFQMMKILLSLKQLLILEIQDF